MVKWEAVVALEAPGCFFFWGAQVATKIGLLVYWPVLFRSQVRQVAMKNRNADIASEQKELL